MKPYLQHLLGEVEEPLQGRHLVREYLQARILESLQRAGAMIPLAFQGGTALRFLYGLARYSEDLDFALERQPEGYDFRQLTRRPAPPWPRPFLNDMSNSIFSTMTRFIAGW